MTFRAYMIKDLQGDICKNNKKKILFVSAYFEVLKTYLPYIRYLRDKYDIYVLSSCLPFGDDQARCEKLLTENRINGFTWASDNPIDVMPERSNRDKKKDIFAGQA